MTTHTSGPWKVFRDRAGTRISTEWIDPQLDDYYPIVTLGYTALDNPDLNAVSVSIGHANARLIAAAPDLLKACEIALQWMAEECWETINPDAEDWVIDHFGVSVHQQIRAAISKATETEAHE